MGVTHLTRAVDLKNSFLIFVDDPHGPDMASFNAVLQVSGKQYEIIYSDFNLHQYIDSLGRPASPTFGGTVNLAIQSPPGGDSLLFEWMIDPAMELNAQVVLWDLTGKMLKVIKLYNAYCVNLEGHFDATGRGQQAGGSLRHSLRISPQAVAINGQFHDNDCARPQPNRGLGLVGDEPAMRPRRRKGPGKSYWLPAAVSERWPSLSQA